MKFAIIIPDGCADAPLESLGGKTPLQAAQTPAMDQLARIGVCGLTDNVPARFPAGSEVANMALLGYDPNEYFTGRAPIEAAAQGIELGPNDWAIRCNTVTIQDQVMVDFTAGHVTTEESRQLLASVQEALNDDTYEFITGVSYRNLLIYRGKENQAEPFSKETRTSAPHDLTDGLVVDDYPRGPGCDLLCELMNKSEAVLENHPVNLARVAKGLKPVTHLWLWGLGKSPQLPSFQSRYGIRGAMITAVDLLRGLGALVGWDRIEVEGATGYLDTNYAGKGQAAVEALKKYDIVCVHVEAPDEASHEGRVDEKIKALEAIDREIVAPIHAALKESGEYRILVLPDHQTPVSTKKHAHGKVPFVIAGAGIAGGKFQSYSEADGGQGESLESGWELMKRFLDPKWNGA